VGHHRWQRTPPTETNGRMHTSTVLVTLIDDKQVKEITISESDLEVRYTTGTGAGGQHKNRTSSCVIMKHIPSGLKIKIDGRNQHQNYREAKKELQKKLNSLNNSNFKSDEKEEKRNQVGINNRSNKMRTYNVKTGLVKNHISGKKTSLRNIYKGKLELIH